MQPMEHMLSPIIKNRDRIINQTLKKSDITLMEKIKKQKMDVLNRCISPSQVDLVRPEIVESWIRSYDYGVDFTSYNAPVLEKHTMENLLKEKELLIKVMDSYIRQFENLFSPYVIFLSDEKGVLLHVVVGKNDKRAIEEFKVAPGVVWSEETVGTITQTMCARLESPIQVFGPEHYGGVWDEISGSSAPIFDLNHNLVGVLTIGSMYHHLVNSRTLGLAVSMAGAIQKDFQLAMNNDLLSAILETSDEAVIIVNKKGIITKTNINARKIFSYLDQDLNGGQIESVLGNQSFLKSVLETGKQVRDTDIKIEKWNQRMHLCSARPLKDYYGKVFGCVLTLRKIDQVRKIGSSAGSADARFTFDKIVGNSHRMARSIDMAKKLARLDANILIEGESGTGKEMYAQAIHNESRPNGPFIAINCAAIPRTLIESELFGYEGGTFTGAERQGRQGKVELANGGTLFLDEIGDMPLELQPVLLRVLEDKKVMRVGGNRYLPVDFRLIAASSKNLLDLVKNNQFREDLYYRLAIFKIYIPPQ